MRAELLRKFFQERTLLTYGDSMLPMFEEALVYALEEKSNKVKILYFKPSGKYYSEGEYVTTKTDAYEVFAEVRNMFQRGLAPGLSSFDSDFTAFVFPQIENGFPAMIKDININDKAAIKNI